MNIREAEKISAKAFASTMRRRYLYEVDPAKITILLDTENNDQFNFIIDYSDTKTSIIMSSNVNRTDGLVQNCVTSLSWDGVESNPFCRDDPPAEIQPQGT